MSDRGHPAAPGSGAADGPTGYRTFLETRSAGVDVGRYLVAGALVAALGAGLVLAVPQAPATDVASDTADAVMLDLPPAEASSQPSSDTTDGPVEQAAAAVPDEAPAPVAPAKPDAEPEKASPADPVQAPPPPPMPDPPAVLERKASAPPPVEAAPPPASAAEERAPSGSGAPIPSAPAETSGEGRPRASKHAITLWQRALMRHLDAARHLISAPRTSGTALVAFRIDAHGALTAERVTSSSGSGVLDRAALALVRLAAPFPAPPTGSDAKETSFVVPIRFR